MVLSVDIANRAIFLMGDNQPPIIGSGNYPNPTFDTSPAGIVAASLYIGVVNTVGRQFGWDFSRKTVVLAQGNLIAPIPWKFEYLYPGNGIQIRQLIPGGTLDPNNPLPIRWAIGNDQIAGIDTKVILSNINGGYVVYSNEINENLWDAGFTETVVRLLSSEFAEALAGRPETAQRGLEAFQAFEGAAETRTEG